MALPPDPDVLSVVLPLQGDPVPLLDAVALLVDRWPAHVDARLVVPTAPLSTRDRTVLARLGDDAVVVELPTATPGYGELVVAGVDEERTLVLDPARLPGTEDLLLLAEGRPAAGGALLRAADFATLPVLDAAGDLPGLQALLTLLMPVPAPAAVPGRQVPRPPLDVDPTGTPDLVSVVLPVGGPPEAVRTCVEALRRSTRKPYELVAALRPSTPTATRAWLTGQRDVVVVDASDAEGYAAACNRGIAASSGEHVVLLQDDAVVPRFWVEGLLRALQDGPQVAAAGPRATGLPGLQRAVSRDVGDLRDLRASADAWRRRHAGRTQEASSLAGGCLAVRRTALRQVGGLDESVRGSLLAHEDLAQRLIDSGGRLRVADEVLVHLPVAPGLDEPAAVLAADLAGRGPGGEDGVFVSAALIVKDEQRALPLCLAALRHAVDEVVVCDTGSSDRTVEIAEAFGARVVSTPWRGDFAAARNHVLGHCRGTWVLSVDADEQLHLEPDVDLRRALRRLPADAATVPVRSRTKAGEEALYEHQAERLFRRGDVSWTGAVHETLVSTQTGAPLTYSAVTSGLWLDHDGYLERVHQERDKTRRNLVLAEKDRAEAVASPDSRRTWKTAYELARALPQDDDNAARVEELLLEALRDAPRQVLHLRADMLVRLAAVQAVAGRLAEAEESARAAVAAGPVVPSAVLVLGQVLAAQDRWDEALAVLDLPVHDEPGAAVRDRTVQDVQLPTLRARLLHVSGRPAEAAELLLRLGAAHPTAVDWSLAYAVLRTQPDGSALLAGLAQHDLPAALAVLDHLPDDDRRALHVALADLGLDAAAHSPAALLDVQLDRALVGHDDAAVEQAALALEDRDPAAALGLWQRLPETARGRAAMARCLLQLGRVDDAVDVVEGLDTTALEPADLLVVAAVAGAAGDRETARDLLLGLRQGAAELDEQVDGLAEALGLAV